MRNNSLIAVALITVLALPGAAWAASLPYPTLAWERFPSRQWSLQHYDPAAAYVDWDPSAVSLESYREAEQGFGETYGLVTCQVYDPLLIAAVYYSSDGYIYIAHEPMQLSAGQRITLTWRLPSPRDEGVSRLLLLDRVMSAQDWERFLINPVEPGVTWRGVVTEQWLGRQPVKFGIMPWEDVLRLSPTPPVGFSYDAWPACRAWLKSDLSLETKDCWITTDCLASFSIDEYGPTGCWQLDWSSEFVFGCSLPSVPVSEAMLVLTGKAKADFVGSADPELEIDCNGWRLDAPLVQASQLSSGLQQYYVDVGQYTQAGENRFALRLDAASGGVLQLESVELWVR